MCSQVAPRQFVNSTEKGCHAEKSDFREAMAQGWQETQLLQFLPEAYEPSLTHKQHPPWQDQRAACPSTPDAGLVLVQYCSALRLENKN